MRLTASLAALILITTLLAWPVLAVPAPKAPQVLDVMRADYLEDEQTGRRLADLSVRLVEIDGEKTLRLRVAAQGASVDPVPSFRGVHGANHITARDLSEYTGHAQLKLVVMPRHGKGRRYGTVVRGATGHIPERRLLPGGRLDLAAQSAERYVLAIDCTTPSLGDGEHEVYLEVKGVPRLRVDIRVAGVVGRIVGIECLGGHNVRVRR